MATLNTPAEVDAELAATADYDVENDLAKAKRRAAALRRKLDFPSAAGRGEMNVSFQVQAIEGQLQQVLAWIQANDPNRRSGQVIHADFSTFRGYRASEGCL